MSAQPTAVEPKALTATQIHALFDVLTHQETYAEIENFKYPQAITSYGYPFKPVTDIPLVSRSGTTTPAASTPRTRTPAPTEERKEKSTIVDKCDTEANDEKQQISHSPVLQTLLTRFVLPLPWLRDLPRDFWAVRVQGLLARLADANLSESYDKGTLGLRKTLATGASALIEMVGRGALGGVEREDVKMCEIDKGEGKSGKGQYDHGKAEDLERAWDDAVQGLVYGNLVEEMCAHMTRTDDLEGHSHTIKAAAEYSIIHLATFLHHIFVVSPEGQYLLQLIQNVHNLVPYKMVKQTLRIGNVVTMINGMVRLLLTKLSVGSITNWVGLTSNADDGMNLFQRIMSLVLSWDAAEFKKIADKIEKDKKQGPDAEVLKAIQRFVNEKERIEQEAVRSMSASNSESIIDAILEDADLTSTLSDTQHAQCLEYYSSLLSIHDRNAIAAVLCRGQPDLLTHMIREAVTAYEPFIRMVHTGVDLRDYVESMQGFIDEFITASKPSNGKAAGVEDYVELLMRNRGILYRWIHGIAGKCPEVWGELEAWAKGAFGKFRADEPSKENYPGKTRSLQVRLNDLFQALPSSSQTPVLEALNAHTSYLATLKTISNTRLQHILNIRNNPFLPSEASQDGPGMYLARWQALLDETAITPATSGKVRKGADVRSTLAVGKTGDVVVAVQEDAVERVDVSVVIRELGEGFRGILRELGGPDW